MAGIRISKHNVKSSDITVHMQEYGLHDTKWLNLELDDNEIDLTLYFEYDVNMEHVLRNLSIAFAAAHDEYVQQRAAFKPEDHNRRRPEVDVHLTSKEIRIKRDSKLEGTAWCDECDRLVDINDHQDAHHS